MQPARYQGKGAVTRGRNGCEGMREDGKVGKRETRKNARIGRTQNVAERETG
jgi:hypothetical protein